MLKTYKATGNKNTYEGLKRKVKVCHLQNQSSISVTNMMTRSTLAKSAFFKVQGEDHLFHKMDADQCQCRVVYLFQFCSLTSLSD